MKFYRLKFYFSLIILCIFLSSGHLSAQKQGKARIDSLLIDLNKAKDDSNKVKLLTELSSEYKSNNPIEGFRFGNWSLQLAKKINWERGISIGYNCVGNIQLAIFKFEDACKSFEKSNAIAFRNNFSEIIGNNFIGIGNSFSGIVDYTKAKNYYNDAIKIFTVNGDYVGVLNTYLSYADMLRKDGVNDSALVYYEKAQKIAEKNSDAENISECLSCIGYVYYILGNYSKSLIYLEKALVIAQEQGNRKHESICNDYIAAVYWMLSDYPKALNYYESALKIANELEDKTEIANIYGNMGLVYYSLSNYLKALEFHERALKITEFLKDKSAQSRHLGNIGDVYKRLKNYNRALEYYFGALKMAKELGDKTGVSYWLDDIGDVYTNLNDYKQALIYYQKSLKISEEIGFKNGIGYNLGNIGDIFEKFNNYPKALEFYEKALAIKTEIGDRRSVSINYKRIGVLHFNIATKSFGTNSKDKTYHLLKSRDYLELAISGFKERSELEFLSMSLFSLSDTYSELNDYKNALEKFKEATKFQDSVFSNDNKRKIAELEAQHILELKEKENEILKKDKELQRIEITRQSILRNYLIIIAIFILLLAAAILNRYLFRKKQNLVLEEKNNLLAAANHELDKTYKEKIQFQEQAHENEKQIINLKNEKLESELELKQKELTTLAINLVDKNEYLRKLKEQVELIGKANVGDVGALVRMIVRSINFNARSEESWQIFEAQFKVIHRGFMEFIATQFPELSVTEMKICTLLKINLSSKEISSMMNLSLRTVEDHRFNIRKKMNLDKDINLNQYIALLKFNGINHN